MRKDIRKNNYIENLKEKFRRPIGYLIWLFIILLALSTVRNVGKVSRVRKEIEREKERIAKIEAENRELEEKVALTNSQEFLEKEIRNKLGLVKLGEVVVVLPDEDVLKKLSPQIKEEKDFLPDPNWKKWFKLFST